MSIDEIADMIRVGVGTIQEWLAEREEMFVKQRIKVPAETE